MGKVQRLEPAEFCHELIVYLKPINDFGCCDHLQRMIYFAHAFDLRVSCNSRNKRPLLSYIAMTAWSQRRRRSDFSGTFLNCVKRLSTSVRTEHFGSHWTDFHEIWYLSIFRKSVRNIQVSLKSDKNKGYFTWWPAYIFIISRSILLRMRKVSDNSCRQNKSSYCIFNDFFFLKACLVWNNMEKFCRARHATGNNMVYGHCILYN